MHSPRPFRAWPPFFCHHDRKTEVFLRQPLPAQAGLRMATAFL
nr:MAG TPA_asm: hypothetical protein [Caudoviricetes sp.]